jgi:3-deoxy-7-phosphoheptulonate synthase
MSAATAEKGLEKAIVRIGNIEIGGEKPVIIAGPCAVESREQIIEIAQLVKEAGADMLRGGAYKPRSNPYSFQGLREKGLAYLAKARELVGLPIVTEITCVRKLEFVARYANMLQVGTRNMQNYDLLTAIGEETDIPILLKRGLTATLDEFLNSAEYIAKERKERGVEPNIVLCLRGVRISHNRQRCKSDYHELPELRKMTDYPVIFDPSHAVGNGRSKNESELIREQVVNAAKAALRAGVDGLIVEVYPDAVNKAQCDAHQQLSIPEFREIVEYAIAPASQREKYLSNKSEPLW